MKLSAVALAVALASCLAGPAQAEIIEFHFPITVSQEVPEPFIPYPEGIEPSGVGYVKLNTETNEIEWKIDYAGLTGDVTGAHFHGPANIGQTAGAQVSIAAIGEPSGTFIDFWPISEQQKTDLLAGLWYVNIHTARNPAGEIRGQVLTEPIPEPAVMSVLGLGGLLVLRRRRLRTS